MKRFLAVASLTLSALSASALSADNATPLPSWAYVVDPRPDVVPPPGLVRQMIDIKRGFRSGPSVAFMSPVVASLSEGDIIDVIAYASSRAP